MKCQEATMCKYTLIYFAQVAWYNENVATVNNVIHMYEGMSYIYKYVYHFCHDDVIK